MADTSWIDAPRSEAPEPDPAEVVAQFWVPGKPVQQGSKNVSSRGKVYEAAKGHKEWRRTVSDVAALYVLRNKIQPFTQARVWATYVFPRPKAHYRANGEIKPQYLDALHIVYPDRDKLDRCLNDGLTQGGIIVDDSRIYAGTSRKIYVNPDVPAPGCLVTIRP
jgi:Holliday junction resolvase RusA-like endonuclease